MDELSDFCVICNQPLTTLHFTYVQANAFTIKSIQWNMYKLSRMKQKATSTLYPPRVHNITPHDRNGLLKQTLMLII